MFELFNSKKPHLDLLAALLSKEWEWVSKVQSSNAGSASKLWVESLASDGSVGANVAGESAPAGITDVDTGSHGGGEGKATSVAAQLSAQVDGGVDGVVVAHLNVGLNVGPELTGGRINVDAELRGDWQVCVSSEDVEAHKGKGQSGANQGCLGAKVLLVVDLGWLEWQEPVLCKK